MRQEIGLAAATAVLFATIAIRPMARVLHRRRRGSLRRVRPAAAPLLARVAAAWTRRRPGDLPGSTAAPGRPRADRAGRCFTMSTADFVTARICAAATWAASTCCAPRRCSTIRRASSSSPIVGGRQPRHASDAGFPVLRRRHRGACRAPARRAGDDAGAGQSACRCGAGAQPRLSAMPPPGRRTSRRPAAGVIPRLATWPESGLESPI